jgi:polysaccharide transporter, PST family
MGMLVMLAMTIIQRAVGFFRGIWICRLLDDTEVGQWAMAIGFIMLMTPVMLFGIPGSLPRYVERYRLQGHLPSFVRRMGWITATCMCVFLICAWLFPTSLGWFIFLEPQNVSLVYSIGVAVVSIATFYFVNELISSLRQVRVVSFMQFVQSVLFTAFAIMALYGGYGLIGVVLSYSASTLIAILPGMYVLMRGWRGLPVSEEPFCVPSMWRNILPYAGALWAMNLIGNVFELSDRYMILHLTPGGELVGQAAVGQYHSGRMLPVLLMSLATLVGGVLMPYLSADWENGKRDEVRDRMRRVLLAVSAFFTLGGAFSLVIAPWMFSTLLENRYSDGLAMMPIVFVFCIWAALVTLGENYLLVAERGKLVAICLSFGLLANLGLNWLLLPIWGLHGAVIATLCAHGTVLVTLWFAMSRSEFAWDRTVLYITLLPATLLMGPWVAIASVVTVVAASAHARLWLREAAQMIKLRRTMSA